MNIKCPRFNNKVIGVEWCDSCFYFEDNSCVYRVKMNPKYWNRDDKRK